MNYLISGGGTGGHIFPAVSIANALRELDPECKILFVGAEDRMEMQRVPQAGYDIVGLPVQGLDRQRPWRNFKVLFNLCRSMLRVRKIIRDFRPDAAVGVGGYASAAAMKVAARMGIPVLLQEQNGFAGVTNKFLRNDAQKICVAYEGMERFFPKEKLILTGNPVRQNLTNGNKSDAIRYFNQEYKVGFTADRKTLLVIGGSLGAVTINESISTGLDKLLANNIQVVWQTGKKHFDKCRAEYEKLSAEQKQLLVCTDFLSRMELAYAMADLVVSRAGASSISELCLLGKPAILVPSPNVAENHQYHNAMALVNKQAAILVEDSKARKLLVSTAIATIGNNDQLNTLSANILALAQRDSALRIAKEVIEMTKHNT